MVLNKEKQTIEHKSFKDLLDYFDEGDLFVMNNTRVFPALLYGEKEKTGAKIVVKALEAPVMQIATNAGLEGAVIIDKIKSGAKNIGFDVYNEKYVDMFTAGIVDPVKVTRSALENASSVAAMVLTTESLVADKKEPAAAVAAAPNPAMGGMY